MTMRSALVMGGGIAGPVVAMFLARIGIEVHVVEARGGDAEGAFLGIAPNGMHVLGELGVAPAIAAIGVPCVGFSFRNAAGRRIAGIDRHSDAERFGAPLTMVRRADLHRALLGEARRRGVRVTTGRRLVGLDQHAEGVVARLDAGGELEADILLGCDGIRSATRGAILPAAPSPAFTGLTDLAGMTSWPEAPLEVGWNEMVFGRRAFFGAFKTPAGEVWWFHNAGGASPAKGAGAEELRAGAVGIHEGDPPFVSELIRRTDRLLGPYPLHDILALPRWHVGRVCLVGDAAHATSPSSGQGASMAIEDGLALARCLRGAGTPEAAFAAFEAARRDRVEWIVRQSRRNGSTKAPPGPIMAWVRDRMLPLFLRLGARDQERAYAHREPGLTPSPA